MKTANNLFSGVAGKVFDRACAIVSECDQGKKTLDDALDSVPSEYRRIVIKVECELRIVEMSIFLDSLII